MKNVLISFNIDLLKLMSCKLIYKYEHFEIKFILSINNNIIQTRQYKFQLFGKGREYEDRYKEK